MESDLGVKGAGNHYTTYFRQYDPRSGRWWSTDPVIHPWQSSYTAMDNNPVRFTDPFGDDCVGCPDPNTVPVGTEQTDELGNLYINWEREDNTGHYWEVRTETAEVLGKRPELTPIWDMGSGGVQDPPPTQLGQAQQTIAANWSNLRGLREQQALALRNSINPAADVTRVVLPIPGEEASKFMGASVSGDDVPRMSAPPPGWSLQRPFEKETTAAEWFESTDIPLMAVVRGITEIPARSLEVTANYACILATGKRCDGSDPTPEDLESGYYSLMPGGGKGAMGGQLGRGLKSVREITSGRLKGFSRGNTELPGGTQGAKDLFKQLTGRNPRGGFDRTVLDDGREVLFRGSSKSGPSKIEVVNPKNKFLEKITFPE